MTSAWPHWTRVESTLSEQFPSTSQRRRLADGARQPVRWLLTPSCLEAFVGSGVTKHYSLSWSRRADRLGSVLPGFAGLPAVFVRQATSSPSRSGRPAHQHTPPVELDQDKRVEDKPPNRLDGERVRRRSSRGVSFASESRQVSSYEPERDWTARSCGRYSSSRSRCRLLLEFASGPLLFAPAVVLPCHPPSPRTFRLPREILERRDGPMRKAPLRLHQFSRERRRRVSRSTRTRGTATLELRALVGKSSKPSIAPDASSESSTGRARDNKLLRARMPAARNPSNETTSMRAAAVEAPGGGRGQ